MALSRLRAEKSGVAGVSKNEPEKAIATHFSTACEDL